MTRRLLSHRKLLSVASAGIIAAGLGACSSASPGSGSGSSGSGSSQTLVMESSPETAITQDFNPYIPTGSAYQMGATGLIYEPLIQFDIAAPPKYYPWLATGYSWSNGGRAITFTIRQGVKWSSGSALTPADVAFTFNLMKTNTSINSGGLDISSVSTSGETVTVNFPTPQYTNLEEIAGVAIVPQSIWGKAGNPGTYTDANPIGTGPYVLSSFTPQGFTLAKNPHYWQASMVKVSKIYFPVYTSNTSALSALFSGQIAWTGNFIPGLQQQFVDKSPSYHHYWEAAGATNSLMPNLNTWPTNQLAVRQAISLALNRSVIASEGEAGLEAPQTNTTGLTLPTFQAWSAPVSSMTMSPAANPAAAERVLEAAGYTKGSGGYFTKDGKTVSLTITDPSAYTDYAEDDAIAAQDLRAAGIDATFQGQAVTAWSTDVADGDFQLTLHWGNGGITPYSMYDGWLNSSLATGSAATGDYERLKDPAINADLAALATASSVSQEAADLVPIEKYIAANLPVIPTTTASEWFEYNSQDFTGWPTQQDPYDTGQPSGTNNGPGSGTDEVVALHLAPRS